MADWPYNTAAWRNLRAAKLMASPMCEACHMRERITPAKAVDHMQPINQGGEPFPPLDRLMSLCSRCHNEKTAGHDRTQGGVTGRRFKGTDAKGNPIDPLDGWHGGASHHGRSRTQGPTPPSRIDIIPANASQKWVL